MRRRIYLMRHADVAYFDESGRPLRPADVSLTPLGREQARAAARVLAPVCFDRVITSGLPRALETAQLVVAELEEPPRREIEQWPDLRELRGGRLRDIPEDELEDVFLSAFRGVASRHATFLAGESIGSLLDRVLAALERLCADDEWKTVLCVLHGGVNRAILSFALTGEPTFFGHLEQAAACVNIVDVGPDWVVRAVNVTPYDPAHVGARSTTMEELLEEYLPHRRSD